MTDNGINTKRVISAAIAVIFLMFVFGLTHRILAEKLVYSEQMPPINPDDLAKFPMEIGLWKGQEAPLPESIIEATDTDAHISRNYFRNNGLESIGLYVAFGQKTRDLIPHRPEVCYIGAGWARLGLPRSVELSLDDGTRLPCSIMQFSKGTSKTMILDYYIVDGRFFSDISSVRLKIWRGSGAVSFIAQVQIVSPVSYIQNAESTERIISAFAVESAPLLIRLLEDCKISKPAEKLSANGISEESVSD
ncbi:MAG: EpsI family protein [Sedimentisphaerales bacterium]|nr:EpsI family protein [Sedimentisphaerales bacterium]